MIGGIIMSYTLPIAGKNQLGGIKIGEGFTITPDGRLDIKDYESLKTTLYISLQNIISGKTLIANSITEKGVDTRFDDTFQQMANNILNISSGSDIKIISKVEKVDNPNKFKNLEIKTSHICTSSTFSDAMTQSINDILNTIYNELSQYSERVDKNTMSCENPYGSKWTPWIRETYKFNDSGNYLLIELHAVYKSLTETYLQVAFRIVDSIIVSGFDTNGEDNEITSTVYKVNYSIEYNLSEPVKIDILFYLKSIKTDTVKLYIVSLKDYDNVEFRASIGFVKCNDTNYLAITRLTSGTGSKYLYVFKNAKVYSYTSIMVVNNEYTGVYESDYILTLPVYISDSNLETSRIHIDSRIENMIQTTTLACEYGNFYKINDNIYYALYNNLLIKL